MEFVSETSACGHIVKLAHKGGTALDSYRLHRSKEV